MVILPIYVNLVNFLKKFCALNVGDTIMSRMAWLQQIKEYKEQNQSDPIIKGKTPEKILDDLINKEIMAQLDSYSIKLNANITRIDKYFQQ